MEECPDIFHQIDHSGYFAFQNLFWEKKLSPHIQDLSHATQNVV